MSLDARQFKEQKECVDLSFKAGGFRFRLWIKHLGIGEEPEPLSHSEGEGIWWQHEVHVRIHTHLTDINPLKLCSLPRLPDCKKIYIIRKLNNMNNHIIIKW